jgi:coatomer subunit beta'
VFHRDFGTYAIGWHVLVQLDVAEGCLRHAKDLSGLLLLYSAVGDAEGLEKLSASARENGKNNVAFVSLFLLGKVEECIELLIER